MDNRTVGASWDKLMDLGLRFRSSRWRNSADTGPRFGIGLDWLLGEVLKVILILRRLWSRLLLDGLGNGLLFEVILCYLSSSLALLRLRRHSLLNASLDLWNELLRG